MVVHGRLLRGGHLQEVPNSDWHGNFWYCNAGEGQGYFTQERKRAKIFTALGFILN